MFAGEGVAGRCSALGSGLSVLGTETCPCLRGRAAADHEPQRHRGAEKLGAGKTIFGLAPWPPCSVTSVVRPYSVFGFRPCRGCFASPGLRDLGTRPPPP